MQQEHVDFTTPLGRSVGGAIWEKLKSEYDGEVKKIKSGPNEGQDMEQYVIVLAIPKDDPEVDTFRSLVHDTAQRDFPALFDGDGNLKNPNTDFAFKYRDGGSEEPDANGNKPCDKEGYLGCWVFTFTTMREIKRVGPGGLTDIIDKDKLKIGDWVRIAGSMVGNGQQGRTAGIYLNLGAVEFQEKGKAISGGGVDAKKAFATAPQGKAPAKAAPAAPGKKAAPAAPGKAAAPKPPPPAHEEILDTPRTLDERLSQELRDAGTTWQDMVDQGWTEETAIASPEKHLAAK